jgi:lactoylglutathione lyase
MKLNIAEFTNQFGIILFVEHFPECEKFYAETIGLRILYRAELLTAFEFGNGYLMLEVEGSDSRKAARGLLVIRFNVEDLIGAANHLKQRGVGVVIHHFDWGSIAVFTDPDGNRCEPKTPLAR